MGLLWLSIAVSLSVCHLVNNVANSSVVDAFSRLQILGSLGDVLYCGGVYLLEQRNDVESELVSGSIVLEVGAVGHPRLVALPKECLYFLAANL